MKKRGEKFLGIMTILLLSFYTNLHRLYQIIIKNLKILVRSKSSALVIILGPLVIIALVGMAFSGAGSYDISIGTFSEGYSELSNGIIDDLVDDGYFVKKINTTEDCRDSVKKGEVNLCLVFSPNMVVDQTSNNQISFYVDYSRVNLVYSVMDGINQVLIENADAISLDMTNVLLEQTNKARGELEGKDGVLASLIDHNKIMRDKITRAAATFEDKDLNSSTANLGFDELKDKMDEVSVYLDGEGVSLTLSGYNEMFDLYTVAKEDTTDYIDLAVKFQLENAKTAGYLGELGPLVDKDAYELPKLRGSMERAKVSLSNIQVTSAEDVVSPIKTNIEPVVSEESHLNTIFPTFLTLVIIFVCIMLGSTLVLNEKSTRAHFRNFISPTRDSVFLLGTYLTCLLIVAVQVAIIFLVSSIFLNESMISGLGSTLYPLFLLTTLFILVGIVIGYLFNSSETAMLAALFIVSASLLFSNTVLPLETIPGYLKTILVMNPFVIGEGILRGLVIFNLGLSDVGSSLGWLWLYIFIVLAFSYLSMKLYKKKIKR
jgi:ABC-type multidrug transport system permease subunit